MTFKFSMKCSDMRDLLIRFRVKGQPVPKGRPRLTRRGRAYTPKKTKVYQKRISDHVSQYWIGPPSAAPMVVEIVAVFQRPKSMNRRRDSSHRIIHTKRGDADNVAKSILDSLNGLVWFDDCQVYDLSIVKMYAAKSEGPAIEVKIYQEKPGLPLAMQ